MATPSVPHYRQLPLPLSHVPELAELAGLRDIDFAPYCSDGPGDDGEWAVWREHVTRARHRVQLGLNPRNAHSAVMLDIDHPHAVEHVAGLALDGLSPFPNLSVERIDSGHAHAVFTLAHPVHLNEHSRANPIRVLARASEYLAQVTGADRGYAAVTMHNPLLERPGFRTHWHHAHAYTLRELRDYIPKGWRMPRQDAEVRTAEGRNCTIWRDACSWAALRDHDGIEVLTGFLTARNAAFWDHPLGPLGWAELAGIGRSVEKWRDKIRADGWHRPDWIARRVWGGVRSGESRRAAVHDRDRQIVALWAAGYPVREIAAVLGCDRGSVWHTIQRDHDGPRQVRLRDPELVGSVLQLHAEGHTGRRIAALLDCGHGTVQRVLRQAAERGTIQLQGRGPRPQAGIAAQARQLHAQGLSQRAIATELGCTRGMVIRLLKQSEVDRVDRIESVLSYELPKIGLDRPVGTRIPNQADSGVDSLLHTESVPEVGFGAENRPPNVDSDSAGPAEPAPQDDPPEPADPDLAALVRAADRHRGRVWR